MAKSLLWAPMGAAAALAAFDLPQEGAPGDCARRLHQVAHAQGLEVRPGERLVSDRQGRLRRDLSRPGDVRLHYLVDRRIDGCPVAVVSPTRFEAADRAIGRELGRRGR